MNLLDLHVPPALLSVLYEVNGLLYDFLRHYDDALDSLVRDTFLRLLKASSHVIGVNVAHLVLVSHQSLQPRVGDLPLRSHLYPPLAHPFLHRKGFSQKSLALRLLRRPQRVVHLELKPIVLMIALGFHNRHIRCQP